MTEQTLNRSPEELMEVRDNSLPENPWRDKGVLETYYVEEGFTSRQCAEVFGCTKTTVLDWIDRHDIEKREGGHGGASINLGDKEGKQWLVEKYVKNGLKQSEIAELADCSQHHISVKLREHGIETNSIGDYQTMYHGFDTKGYERVRHKHKGESFLCYIHRLLAVAVYGFDEVAGNDVHHKNNHKIDNRHENVKPMSCSNHMTHHAIERGLGGEQII